VVRTCRLLYGYSEYKFFVIDIVFLKPKRRR